MSGHLVPAWMQSVRDRSGPFLDRAFLFLSQSKIEHFPSGTEGIRKLAALVESFAYQPEATAEEDARFVEGAGAMLAMILIKHFENAHHCEHEKKHQLEFSQLSLFNPFDAIDCALDAKRPSLELSRRIAIAEKLATSTKANPLWDDVYHLLFPRIVSKSFLDNIHENHEEHGTLFSCHLVGELYIAFVLNYQDRSRYLREDEIATWQLSHPMILHQAIMNLTDKSTLFSNSFTIDNEIVMVRAHDGHDAARILLPLLYEMLCEIITAPMIISVPHRDILLAATATGQSLEKMLNATRLEASRSKHRISSDVYLLTHDGLQIFDPSEPVY